MDNCFAFDLNTELSRDVGRDDCITINTGKDGNGLVKNTLVHVQKTVAKLLESPDALKSVTKLYVTGDFILDLDMVDERHGKGQDETNLITPEEHEWTRAVEYIDEVIQRMESLLELTWVSGLPFLDLILQRLPRKLVKLRFDIQHPVRLDTSDFRRPIYFQRRDMKPLTEFVKLKELRIFGMMESCQSVIWETVWRSEAEGKMMELLELTMCLDPIIRSGPSQTKWVKADGVKSIMRLSKDEAVDYRGMGGRGFLHHSYGYGEYLDVISIRKARLATGIAEDAPSLPLLRLILDGFVVDSLPFEVEMNAVTFLQFGKQCYDAGFTLANRVSRKQGPSDFGLHPTIVAWPNWVAKFNSDGKQLNAEENVAGKAGLEDEAKDNLQGCLTLTAGSLNRLSLNESAIAMRPSLTQPARERQITLDL